jgi:hypothetical protein
MCGQKLFLGLLHKDAAVKCNQNIRKRNSNFINFQLLVYTYVIKILMTFWKKTLNNLCFHLPKYGVHFVILQFLL